MRRRRDRGERGVTLVELMMGMLVSSILIGFVFGVHSRMTAGLRGQAGVTEIGATLAAARAEIVRDLQRAGHRLPRGAIAVASGVDVGGALAALSVVNDADGTGPDALRVAYAGDSVAVVTGMGPVFADVEDPGALAPGDLIVIGNPEAACLLEVTSGTSDHKVHFNPSGGGPGGGGAPFNEAPQNRHCDPVRAALAEGEPTTIYRFHARSYRIDPERREASVLQLSPSGGLVDGDWIDLAIGVTNLQLATRFYAEGDTDDADGDGDPERDWRSGDSQSTPDPTGARPANAVPIQIAVGLEARGAAGNGVGSPATPAFIDLDNVEHNAAGDWGQQCEDAILDPCGVDLGRTGDSERPPRYRGRHRYRSSRAMVDLRNLRVGK